MKLHKLLNNILYQKRIADIEENDNSTGTQSNMGDIQWLCRGWQDFAEKMRLQ